MLTIRQATTKDCYLINRLAHIVFPDTYKDILSPGQLEYMLEWMYSPVNLRKQMEKDHHIYFISYHHENPCGYLSIQQESENVFHLQKIYVLPGFQGLAIGKFLFNHAISYIKTVHPSPCRMELNVNRNNKAVRFYEHMGMKKISQGDFDIGNGYFMNDYIMGIEI